MSVADDYGRHFTLRGRTRRVPTVLWAPLSAGILIAVPGLLGYWAAQPWLFPSLGPTAFLQVARPELDSSKLYNILVGHGLAILLGFATVVFLGADAEPSVVSANKIVLGRLIASCSAAVLLLAAQLTTNSPHPPAAATLLLITLGAFKVSVASATVLIVGILMIAFLGEAFRRLRA